MAYTPVTPTVFKNYFVRDFPYGTTSDKVTDADITKALGQAAFNFNEALFGSQTEFNIGFCYLTAHYLVIDLQTSSQGLSGSFAWLEASKAVGSVSQSFSIPQQVLDHPVYSMLSKTNYGAKFLSLMLPRLVGQIFVSFGGTTP